MNKFKSVQHVPDPSNDELKAHHCLENVDCVPRDPETTRFKRLARLHQSIWRETRGFPAGRQPMRPKRNKPWRKIGSRIEIDYPHKEGAKYLTTAASKRNFLTTAAWKSAGKRVANPEPRQMLDEDRLICDLLSSMPMCFNLFGELACDLELADRAVHKWWPDVPGRVRAVRFEWSPGRGLTGEYLENRSAFDVVFELDLGGEKRGVLGVETKYHEHCKKPSTKELPKPDRRRRYEHIAVSAGVFNKESMQIILESETELLQICLDHLLAASMPLHDSGKWSWASFALVHPAGNPSFARATDRYQELLEPGAAIRVSTIESLLEADVWSTSSVDAFVERYLPNSCTPI